MILILTAGFGDGHNTAARNVAAALTRLAPTSPVQTVDLFDVAHPLLAPVLKNGYLFLITHLPQVWKWMYGHAGTMKFQPGEQDGLRQLRFAFANTLAQLKPQAIISTYPLYAQLLESIPMPASVRPPLFTVVTDSISVHPLWALGKSTAHFVADDQSKESLAKLGVPGAQIHITGFPVSLDFMELPEAMSDERGSILYLPSTTVGHVRRTLEALRPLISTGTRLTLPLGKHIPRLYQTVTRFIDSLPNARIEVIGWTNQIPRLLQTHDLVICKAGGAILHEALAARCPAIIDCIVPGQEEGNAELLTSHNCGVISKSPQESGEIAARLLAHNAAEAKRMSENARVISEPDAAVKIAEHVLQIVGIPSLK